MTTEASINECAKTLSNETQNLTLTLIHYKTARCSKNQTKYMVTVTVTPKIGTIFVRLNFIKY